LAGISYIKAFTRLFYPINCAACGEALVDQESHICTLCQLSLPVTNYHREAINPLNDLLKLRLRVDFISSFLLYDKGLKTQHMLHAIKYKGEKLLATYLGELYGYEIKNTFPQKPDCIIPVPLHRRRFRERGYNQSECWANGLAKSIGTEVDIDSLQRPVYTTTQTKKSRSERISNVENAFTVAPAHPLKGKHVLLVDDVITTGATLEACGIKLWNAGISSLSIATIAYAVK
jgi:ComF family protein